MAGEKKFENLVKQYLRSQGIYPLGTAKDKMKVPPVGYYEKRWGNMFTKSGLPDMHICIHGHSIEVELKAINGRPSELQLFMLDQINTCGGKAVIIYPKDFETFKELVKDYL